MLSKTLDASQAMTAPITICLAVLAAVLSITAVGCGGERAFRTRSQEEQFTLYNRVMDGTVGGMAILEGGKNQVIRGYGLVVGLAGNGSSEVPTQVREQMIRDMGRMGIGDKTSASRMLSPNKLIDDLDTAVVEVGAVLTPGMPSGARFDVEIRSLPGSQTVSLNGGILYRTDLRGFSVTGPDVKETLPVASAKGEVLVNPFVDPSLPDQSVLLLRGRIPGGGLLNTSRRIWLTLPRPDYGLANLLQKEIVSHFPGFPATASAKSASMVEINIPVRWQGDYQHFLELLTHLYVRRGGAYQDMKVRQLTEDILLDGAPTEDIALIWEAMGRQVLPKIKHLLAGENPSARYFTARTGARLDDTDSVEVLVDIALKPGLHQLEAIAELGRCGTIAAVDGIRACFDSDDDLVRIAAFHAMLETGAMSGVRYSRVGESFELYVIETTGKPFIYATRSELAAVVIFGEALGVRTPVFFNSPDGILTITSETPTQLGVYRKVGAEGKLSEMLYCPATAADLIRLLGEMPEPVVGGTVKGLGLTYSQVVSALNRLCNTGENRKIPAEFVLQKPQVAGTISPTRPTGGRANTAAD